MIKHIIIIAGLGLSAVAVHAQASNFKRVAEQFYAKGDYYSAAHYYEKYLSGKTPSHSGYNAYVVQKQGATLINTSDLGGLDGNLLYKMGDCYYNLNDYIHAEQWYKLLLKKDSASFPMARYYYGICLRANGNYNIAQHELARFIQENAAGEQYNKKAQQEIDNCAFIQQQLTNGPTGIKIERLNNNINKEGANYAASWLNSNTLAFTSTRAEGYSNALYSAAFNNGGFGKVEKINVAAPRNTHLGTPTFTPDGSKMFFTGWILKNGKKLSAIYMSERSGDRWSEPVLIDGKLSEQSFNSRQPQVTPDGKYLLFASDRSDGIGGFDIWSATLDAKGMPEKITNLGPAINTTGDEEAPFYHGGSQSLVFASNGRTGMGGFDLYSSNGYFNGSWTVALNLGYPVNSEKDDIYFVGRGKGLLEDAIISSDRASLCCLELFSVHKNYNQVFTGVVLDCDTKQPLEGAIVTAKDPRGNEIATIKTQAGGRYTIQTDAGLALQISGRQDEYNDGLLTAYPSKGDTVYAQELCLAKKPDPFKNKTEVTYQIVFELKTEIAKESYPYLDLIASYLKANPTVVLEIDVHTDGLGSVKSNEFLSKGRANACAEYLINSGVSPNQLLPRGFGECCPIEKETTPDGKDIPAAREKNRRVVFKMINNGTPVNNGIPINGTQTTN
ncbi:OmpA family protein [Longitalea arenae]|uniref:OmpA family protein n=1 Tax=Longitalea arenae TaxID=2812558 RepID=UPI0019684B3B|nr:OmpA family protein [Longitalea arenae]